VQADDEHDAQLKNREEHEWHDEVFELKKLPTAQFCRQTPLERVEPSKQIKQLLTNPPLQVWHVG
jgi:hypothetical protein